MTKPTPKQRAKRRAGDSWKHPEPTRCGGVIEVPKEVMDELMAVAAKRPTAEMALCAKLARIVAAWDAMLPHWPRGSQLNELAAAILAARETEKQP